MKHLIPILIVLLSACHTDHDHAEDSDSKDSVKHAHLISAHELNQTIHQNHDSVILIHVGKSEEYENAHLPKALNIWRPDYTFYAKDSISETIITPLELESLLQRLGVNDSSLLILYDNKGNVDALRFAWLLELYGYTNYKILNGGMKHWRDLQLPIDTGIQRTVSPSEFILNTPHDFSGYASFEELLSNLHNDNYIIIDTREDYEYNGMPFVLNNKIYKHKNGSFVRGKIPGALHLNWSEMVDLKDDHRIKSLKDLQYNLDKNGITPDKQIIVYCQSGSRSAHTYFVLRHLLGYPYVKNYDGSWIEWSYMHKLNSQIPIEQICDSANFINLYDSLAMAVNLN